MLFVYKDYLIYFLLFRVFLRIVRVLKDDIGIFFCFLDVLGIIWKDGVWDGRDDFSLFYILYKLRCYLFFYVVIDNRVGISF